MLFSLVIAAAAVASAPAAGDPVWQTYVCEGGPSIRLALMGDRPAERGFLALETGVVTLERHEGEAKTVLRGDGHMVRTSNWLDVLYAPPGREKNAYQCRAEGAAGRAARPAAE